MMHNVKLYSLLTILIVATSGALLSVSNVNRNEETEQKKTFQVTHSDEELKLYNLINTYRSENNLSKIPLSKSLTYVAQQHCIDLYENKPDLADECNLHSWSSAGAWSSCCYTEDHKQAECMWNKPAELTNYTGYGFEIAMGSSDSIYDNYVMTAEYSLKWWKQSLHHNNVILNLEAWKDTEFNAMGVAVFKGFSAVWFGREVDEEK